MRTIRIGSGAGFTDDRIAPAVELAERGDLDYLVFECLAERTIALAQAERRLDPTAGFSEWLVDRMEAVLPLAKEKNFTIITNMGAANPLAAAQVVADAASRLGIEGLKVAAVTGDDVLDQVQGSGRALLERDGTIDDVDPISANAYLGVQGIVEALAAGADVIVTGRVADPSLFLAPAVHEFGWAPDDWHHLGIGTAMGHLLECAAQVCGGYFADPGSPNDTKRHVPDLAHLGFPLAELSDDGTLVITKAPHTGGCVTVATVTEQLLYEVHDPANYRTPDVTADFSAALLTQIGFDRVRVDGITGTERSRTLKVSVGYVDSCIAEGQISYAGPSALARGRLALDMVSARLEGTPMTESRFELIGVDAVHRGSGRSGPDPEPQEVRVRVVARTTDLATARRIGREVTALWLNGPAGGGGATRSAYEDIAIVSVFLERDRVQQEVTMILTGEPAHIR